MNLNKKNEHVFMITAVRSPHLMLWGNQWSSEFQEMIGRSELK